MNDKTRNILRIAGLATAIGLTLLYGLAVAWYCTPVMREVTCDSLHIVMRDGKELHFITENDVHDFITSQHIHVTLLEHVQQRGHIARHLEAQRDAT